MEEKSENKAGIKVPENLISRFRVQAESAPDPEAMNGTESPEYSGDLEILESLNETLSWICKTGDSMAKQRGFPGLGDVPPDQLGDLLTIVAKRNLPGSVIEKSPETACVAILAGIGVQNYLAHREKMQSKPEPAKQENKDE